MITDVAGVRVGHWTDARARTGCSVVLFPEGTVASGEVRGGAPGTREFALLSPERMVTRVDAVVLSGGSAFGLAACDGVSTWCEERGIGFPTAAGPVPIVVGMVIYDLRVGDASVRPGRDEGYAACAAATDGPIALGQVGVGTGASVGGVRGPGLSTAGGIGSATRRDGDLVVSALVAVNAFGEVDPETGLVPRRRGAAFGNTTIGVVATNARLDKVGCLLVSQSAHDGLARAIDPAHTTVDGDAFVTGAVGEVDAPVDAVRSLAAWAVADSIRSAVEPTSP
jgi:L-aminopeptidase/D-esterase-like protein